MMWVLFASIFTMIVILWFEFRSWQGVFIPILSGALSAIWGLGFGGLFGLSLDPLVLVVPLLISARAHSHSVQSMERYHEEYEKLQDKHAAIVKSYTEIYAPAMVSIAADGLAILTLYVARIHTTGAASANITTDRGAHQAGIGWNPQPGWEPAGCWVTIMYDKYTASVQPHREHGRGLRAIEPGRSPLRHRSLPGRCGERAHAGERVQGGHGTDADQLSDSAAPASGPGVVARGDPGDDHRVD
jgi:hypothetical protein